MKFLLKNARTLETEIDEFLNAISEGMLVFLQGIKNYLDSDTENFKQRIEQIKDYEHKADTLRREIENKLYSHSLIPEHRGDVLGLLENMDHIIDTAKRSLSQFDVESPQFPSDLNDEFLSLAKVSIDAAETIVIAARSFFRDINKVKDNLHKVYYFEKEADRIGDSLMREVFTRPLELAHKMQLRYFISRVERISDRAEEVADRLSIYTIKRNI